MDPAMRGVARPDAWPLGWGRDFEHGRATAPAALTTEAASALAVRTREWLTF